MILFIYPLMATKKAISERFLLQVYLRELHNIMLSLPEEGGLKESKDADNNIIIIDSTLRKIIKPQLKKKTS